MVHAELPPEATAIATSVSTNVCTAQTVNDLRQYLGLCGDTQGSLHLTEAPSATGRPKDGAPLKARPRPTRGARKPNNRIGSRQQSSALLEPSLQALLATQVVNGSLKTLTTVVRQEGSNLGMSILQDNPIASSKVRGNATKPLQPVSPNHGPTNSSRTPHGKRRHLKISTLPLNSPEPNIIALSQCASLAFAALRSQNNGKSENSKRQPFQVELGMSSFISKLIALELDDIASQELQILVASVFPVVSTVAACPKQNLKEPTKSGLRNTPEKPLVDFLCRGQLPEKGQLHELFIISQIQALKLMARFSHTTAFEDILATLDCSGHSVLAAVDRWVAGDASDTFGMKQKASKWLDQIAHTLDKMASREASSKISNFQCGAGLQLKFLGVRVRVRSWVLNGAGRDLQKEVLTPFLSYVSAFAQHAGARCADIYSTLAKLIPPFLVTLQQQISGLKDLEDTAQVSSKLFRLLAELARACQDFKCAAKWLAMALEASCASPCRTLTLNCQFAATKIQQVLSDDTKTALDQHLELVLDGLKQNYLGGASEIDDLFLAVAGLRKNAATLILRCKSRPDEFKPVIDVHSQTLCADIIQSCVKFLVRFAGSVDHIFETNSTDPRDRRRKELVRKSLMPSIEALATVTKMESYNDAIHWKRVADCLLDCQGLAKKFHTYSDRLESLAASQNRGQPFTAISNVFWCRYLEVKSQDCNVDEILTLLELSIAALQERSPEEKEAAFLHVKYERFASAMESRHDYAGASHNYLKALELTSNLPSWHEIKQQLEKCALESNFSNLDKKTRLRPLLTSFLRTQNQALHKSGGSFVPFCHSKAEPKTQRALLELQLAVVVGSLTTDMPLAHPAILEALYLSLQRAFTFELSHQHKFQIHLQFLRGLCIDPRRYPRELSSMIEADFQEFSKATNQEQELHIWREQNEVYFIILRQESNLTRLSDILSSWHQAVFDKSPRSCEAGHFRNAFSLDQLQLLQEFLTFRGHEYLQALVAAILLELANIKREPIATITQSALLAQHLTSLGHCKQASSSLLQAKDLVHNNTQAHSAKFEWYISYAENLLAINNTSKCEEYIRKAHDEVDHARSLDKDNYETISEKYLHLYSVSRLTNLRARLAKANGWPAEAVYFAKKSTRLAYRAWTILERLQRYKPSLTGENSSTEGETSQVMAATNVQPIISTEHDSLKNPAFWKIGQMVFRNTCQLAYMLAHEGSVLEAHYYTDRAEKVALAIGSDRFHADHLVLKLHIDNLAGGKLVQAADIENAMDTQDNLPLYQRADMMLALAETYHNHNKLEAEIQVLKDVEAILKRSLEPPLTVLESMIDSVGGKLSQLSLEAKPATRSAQRPFNAASAKRGQSCQSGSLTVQQNNRFLNGEHDKEQLPLQRRQGQRLRQSAMLSIQLGDVKLAAKLLSDAERSMQSPQDMPAHALCYSTLAMRKATAYFAKDPVFSLLQESTIMHPTAPRDYTSTRNKSDPKSIANEAKDQLENTGASTRRKLAASRTQHSPEILNTLAQSTQGLLCILAKAQTHMTTGMGHKLSDALYKSQLLLSLTNPSQSKEVDISVVLAYAFEYGRIAAFMRDDAAIKVDCILDKEKDDAVTANMNIVSAELSLTDIEVHSFQEKYIDIIPSSWTAISIAISSDHEELRISRIRAHQPPLTISIPLNRHNPRDCDEEPFGFDDGKRELLEIISLANFSAHEGGDLSQKGAKKAWWETRAALDARLKDLILNIQNMWIGGFRGIFSEHMADSELLARFRKNFEDILNQHLPSRQRNAKTAQSERVVLAPQVTELFIGLGEPDEQDDIDEALLDLYYFVVDILQFHGERNAYDEIDFDPMIIATRDALTQYHNMAARIPNPIDRSHTILILDRSLHAFPWESLPCLDSRAVCRLPSLSCLRDRIILQRQQSSDSDCQTTVLTVDSASGTYILNPSGDLSSTHKTFAPSLSALTSWDAIVKSIPSERDITTALSSRSIYLYFGHGSGGQYVRSRAIRKLERCAVALLMGCSSGALIEAGELESYGPPMAYLHAGSPAVVGTLWDVTDKDIDRFAMHTLGSWGLITNKTEARGKKNPKQGKITTISEHAAEEKASTSLDEAVSEARETCILRYLNGAAPVVYGVPVILG